MADETLTPADTTEHKDPEAPEAEAPAVDPAPDAAPESTDATAHVDATEAGPAPTDAAQPGFEVPTDDAAPAASEEAPAEAENPTMAPGTTPGTDSNSDGSVTPTDSFESTPSATPTLETPAGTDAPLVDEAPAEPEPTDDAPVDAGHEAEVADPLDTASAATDASPASEATTGPASAGAPEGFGSANKATSNEEGGGADGDKGLGATHAGTDTPEVMVSQPVDPVTGKPLDGSLAPNAAPIYGGGQAPAAASPSGHVVPEAQDAAGTSTSTADSDDDVAFDGGDDSDAGSDWSDSDDAPEGGFAAIDDKLSTIEMMVADVRCLLAEYEES